MSQLTNDELLMLEKSLTGVDVLTLLKQGHANHLNDKARDGSEPEEVGRFDVACESLSQRCLMRLAERMVAFPQRHHKFYTATPAGAIAYMQHRLNQ